MPYFYENISNSFTKLKSVIVRKDENTSFFRNPVNYMILGSVLLVLILAYFLNIFDMAKCLITKFKVYMRKRSIKHLNELIKKDTKMISDRILLAKSNNQMKYKIFSDVIIARDSIKERIVEVNKHIEFIHEHSKFTDKDILLIKNVKESISNANIEFEHLNLFVIEHKNMIENTMINAKLRIIQMCLNLDDLVEEIAFRITKYKNSYLDREDASYARDQIRRVKRNMITGIEILTKHVNIIDEFKDLMSGYDEAKMMMQISISAAKEKLNNNVLS